MAILRFTVTDADGKKYPETAVIPDRSINHGTKNIKRRDIEAEVNAKWLAGRQHGKSVATAKRFTTGLRHLSVQMKKYHGTTNLAGVTQDNVRTMLERLKTEPSLIDKMNPPRVLAPKSLSSVLKDIRKVLALVHKEHMLRETYGAMGIKVSHKDVQKPVQFTLDRADRRAAFQVKVDNSRTKWYGPVTQMGAAFGHRNSERIASRDTLIKIDGKYYATQRLGKSVEVSVTQLKTRYGETFAERIKVMTESQLHLIIESAKGGRNRVAAINTPEREAAIKRLHDCIRSQPGHAQHMSPHPDKTNPQQAKENFTKQMNRYGATRESQLNSYSDRHWMAQKLWKECLAAGMSKREAASYVIFELGHDSRDKMRYYVNMSNS